MITPEGISRVEEVGCSLLHEWRRVRGVTDRGYAVISKAVGAAAGTAASVDARGRGSEFVSACCVKDENSRIAELERED
jgi:hypothetical protein